MMINEQVFLSYAHEDLVVVNKLYADLRKRGLRVWFDKNELKPGKWQLQIKKAISKSKFFIICLSKASLKKIGDKPGFTDEELNHAYQIATSQYHDEFIIVPLRLEKRAVPKIDGDVETCPSCGISAPVMELLREGCKGCGWMSPRLKEKEILAQ